MTSTGLAARREQYKPSTARVTVSLDSEVAEERAILAMQVRGLEAKQGDRRLTQSSPLAKAQQKLAELEQRERESLVTFEFRKLDGLLWADLAVRYPPRDDVPMDQQLQYNYQAACIAAAELNGKQVNGDELLTPSAEDWEALWVMLHGWDVENIVQAVLGLNVTGAARRLARLKKD